MDNDNGRFNIFKIAKLNGDEDVHTRLIAELMNPNSTFHNNGQCFLDIFLEIIGLNAESFQGAKIQLEVPTLDGRIDIVIETEKYYVPFEVKIWAGDQTGQLARYFKFASESGKEVPYIFYLTPYGHAPSLQSCDGLSMPLRCISWSDEIARWLNKCIEAQPSQDVLQIMIQLRDSLKATFRDVKHTMSFLKGKLQETDLVLTESTPEYLIYRINKQGALEVALRINREGERVLSLLIICGVEQTDGTLDYTFKTYKHIGSYYSDFETLLADTFVQPFADKIDKTERAWARYAEEQEWQDGVTAEAFAGKCYDAINQILSCVILFPQ